MIPVDELRDVGLPHIRLCEDFESHGVMGVRPIDLVVAVGDADQHLVACEGAEMLQRLTRDRGMTGKRTKESKCAKANLKAYHQSKGLKATHRKKLEVGR